MRDKLLAYKAGLSKTVEQKDKVVLLSQMGLEK